MNKDDKNMKFIGRKSYVDAHKLINGHEHVVEVEESAFCNIRDSMIHIVRNCFCSDTGEKWQENDVVTNWTNDAIDAIIKKGTKGWDTENDKDNTNKGDTNKVDTNENNTNADKNNKDKTDKDNTNKDKTDKDNTNKDNTKKDNTKKDNTNEDKTDKDNTNKDKTDKDNTNKNEGLKPPEPVFTSFEKYLLLLVLSKPKRWCQKAYSRDAYGNPIDRDNNKNQVAASFSLDAVVDNIFDDKRRDILFKGLKQHCDSLFGENEDKESLQGINDAILSQKYLVDILHKIPVLDSYNDNKSPIDNDNKL